MEEPLERVVWQHMEELEMSFPCDQENTWKKTCTYIPKDVYKNVFIAAALFIRGKIPRDIQKCLKEERDE